MKQRKDGRWERVVTVNGKRKTFYSDADTETKAEKDIRRQIFDYKEKAENGITFSEAADAWEREAYDDLSHGTVKVYKPSVTDLVNRFGNVPISSITAKEITQYFNELMLKGYAAKTIQRRRSAFNMIMKCAVGAGLIGANPVPELNARKRTKKEDRRALTKEERQIIIQNKNTDYWGFWAYFVMVTGCRRGEAFALTYKDIDYNEKTVSIHGTVEHYGNAGVIKDHTKTEAGMRTVPLTDDIIDMLAVRKKKGTNLIFPDPISDGIITNNRIARGWNKFREDVGLHDVTPHMLRHTYATMLYDAGCDLKSAQYLLGHADMQTTLKIYTHLSEERKAKATDEVRTKIMQFLDE